MFLSAPSTGKTALMEAKAFQCMQNGMNVLFLLPFSDGNIAKTLLTLKMQQQWQNLKEKHQWENNFEVCSIKRVRNNDFIDFKHFERNYEEMRNKSTYKLPKNIWLQKIGKMNEIIF